MLKAVLFASLVLCVTATPVLYNRWVPLEIVNFIRIQEPCVRQGGMCMPVSECNPGDLVQFSRTLCPMMSNPDIQCCYTS